MSVLLEDEVFVRAYCAAMTALIANPGHPSMLPIDGARLRPVKGDPTTFYDVIDKKWLNKEEAIAIFEKSNDSRFLRTRDVASRYAADAVLAWQNRPTKPGRV